MDAEQHGLRLRAWMNGGAEAFDRAMERLLDEGGSRRPPRLMAAMRHAVLAGGKRLRPYLVLASAGMFGLSGEGPLRVAAALECLHCYSLVHDDLPAMDNDDLRRGKPTVHRAFDEATAILAGDALLTHAFALLASPRTAPGAAVRTRLIAVLAEAAGLDGMVGGQMLDLAAEGRFADGVPPAQSVDAIIAIQSLKTGALIRFAAEAGALLAPGRHGVRHKALRRYGAALGLAFQIRDDLIDHEGDAVTAGKATGKDDVAGKATFISLLGPEGARQRLAMATREGLDALACFGDAGQPLADVLAFNATRLS